MESSDLAEEFGNGCELDGMMASEIFTPENLYLSGEQEDENEPDDIIILHMDIREPLRSLKTLLEQKIGVDLKKYTFWLQDAQILEPHKNLVDQCVKGEGLVQINVQIQTINQRINIVDVLKPTDAALAALGPPHNINYQKQSVKDFENRNNNDYALIDESNDSEMDNQIKLEDKPKPCRDWVIDSKFKKEQSRLKIPDDPNDWTIPHVKHWLQWAVRQFNLTKISLNDWNITGSKLCSLKHEEFSLKVPNDPGLVFWTHLQLLKELKSVSVVHKAAEIDECCDNAQLQKEQRIMRKATSFISGKNYSSIPVTRVSNSSMGGVGSGGGYGGGVGSGNNGQVQLWQFLLEILTEREHRDIIEWVGTEGEFKLTDPERVARLWGEKKNKPAMNYEKLSRALRYYYDGDMISKVSGKRFAYKFDCDLKLLIGYNAEEISKLVNEKNFIDDSMYMDKIAVPSDDE